MEWTYENCNAFYPYKNLANAKSRYGKGGVEETRTYNDPNVRWVVVGCCITQRMVGWLT